MWTTEGNHCRLSCGELQASIDVANAAGGLFDICFGNKALNGVCILQCDNASAGAGLDDCLVDHYVREDDLVATYLQSPARVNRKQIYLRPAGFLYPNPILGVELVFSMQTQRLDADPELVIRSEFPSDGIHALVNRRLVEWEPLPLPEDAIELSVDHYCGAVITKISGTDIYYAQILDPSDFAGGRVLQSSKGKGHYAVTLPVFGSTLEKGVIRRGRVSGIFFRGADALDDAARFYEWYRNSPPLLTT